MEYVTFGMKAKPEGAPAGDAPKTKVKFADMLGNKLAKHNASMVKTVQYFNCTGHAYGERVSNK